MLNKGIQAEKKHRNPLLLNQNMLADMRWLEVLHSGDNRRAMAGGIT